MQKKVLNIKLPIVLFGILLIIVLVTQGYAALNEELTISGDAYIRVDEEIRVTGLKITSSQNKGYETYNSKYAKDTTTSFVTLPNADSKLVYEVAITNKSNKNYTVSKITPEVYNNTNLSYTITGLKVGSVINANTTVKFTITFENTVNEKSIGTLTLKYEFLVDTVTAPTIKSSSSSWVSTSPTVSVTKEGTATSGVKRYEFYISNDSTKPSDSTTATGTTSGNRTITNSDGIYYIYYRTVSNLGNKSAWSNRVTVKIDKTEPIVTCSVNDQGYFVAVCIDENGSGCVNNESDSLYSKLYPRASAWIDETSSIFVNAQPSSSADLEAGGLLLNAYGQVQYRNTSANNTILMWVAFYDKAGNMKNCNATIPTRK